MTEPGSLHFNLRIVEASQVGEARRRAVALAQQLGFNDTETGKVALVATEAASNLVKHAREGELLLRSLECRSILGIELLAVDQGPGMNPDRCLEDGYSTAGSPGTGLGAIVRLSADSDIFSTPSSGTVLLARLWASQGYSQADQKMEFGLVHVPKPGELVNGDAWAVQQEGSRCCCLLADGLGHGPLASEASRLAVRLFQENFRLRGPQMVQLLHSALRSTRGAALAVAEVDLHERVVRFTGVGNVAGVIIGCISRVAPGSTRSMISHNGTVGHQVPKVQEFVYSFPSGSLLILHSDGLSSRWNLEQYPGLIGRPPSVIAGLLYKDFKRGRDDATVLVAREVRRDGENG